MAVNPQLGAVARPVDPSDLEAAIQQSRAMLDLPDNWDDDGGSSIDAATWARDIIPARQCAPAVERAARPRRHPRHFPGRRRQHRHPLERRAAPTPDQCARVR